MDKIEKNILCYDDIALIPRHSSLKGRDDCDTSITFLGEKCSMPIILAPMVSLTTPEMIVTFWKNGLVPTVHRYFNSFNEQYACVYLGVCAIFANYKENDDLCWDSDKRQYSNTMEFDGLESKIRPVMDAVYWSVGGIKKHKHWIDSMIAKGIEKYLVDVAHGDTDECIATCQYIREHCRDAKIISGNYTDDNCFYNSDCNAFRMGIGGGSCCTTAKSTGYYYPALQAVKNASESVYMSDMFQLIADGGIKSAGDIAKAMAFGADIAMCGYLFAGTSCAGGLAYNADGKVAFPNKEKESNLVKFGNRLGRYRTWKDFFGMASRRAKNGNRMPLGSVEGAEGLIRYTGSTQEMIDTIRENLKSSLAYCGAKNWTEFFTKVNCFMVSTNEIKEQNERLEHL